ncbi:tetratricopeptide repeat protein [Geomonas subterranea]|uniref:Tetratricopeptide repeat protein n=1 Tax=Geomonas subterranea TaxID=2847989 RepID=A0ABX8LJH1_9BACT|nr:MULTISPECIES: tetratricopeptide repeat protein [Geomonas]QXE92180.1 tetratricopeptide repeat protein [Geomonas subterranea]QXM09721.1 tetratricopeptide repeat protein [Geomonas subterranea]
MNKENVLTVVVALIVGLLGGYLIFNIAGQNKEPQVAMSVPQGAGSPNDYQRRIVEAEKIVAADPKNLQAWIQLGNDYFDTDQAQKAVNAYGKALELDPKNLNVMTDQGIMYRKIGWYDKAIANFELAQSIDPKHLQSLYNLGVVYLQDLKQPDKAKEVWTKYLQFDSTSPTAQQIKNDMAGLNQMPTSFKK